MSYKLLIVDDEEMLTQLLSSHLSNCGYLVYTANCAAAALEKMKCQPDLILLDINMPDMDGLEFCQMIREHISLSLIHI